MQPYNTWHKIAVFLSVIAVIVITYLAIIVNNFRTAETAVDFLQNSNTFYYISEIIKADIRNRYPTQLKNNPIKLTVADTILNTIVTPNLVERLTSPAINAIKRINQLPLSFAENNLVLNTQQYTQQLTNTLSSFNLPSPIIDSGENLIASIPPQITIINTEKNPNSILVAITKMRIIFDNIQTILNVSWIVLLLSLVTIFVVNIRFLKRFVHGFLWIFAASGIFVFILSFVIPAISNSTYSNPDPVTGVLKENLINGIISYYFSLTRTVSIIYILIAIGLYLIYHFVPFPKAQELINQQIFKPTNNKNNTRQNNHSQNRK